MAAAQKRHDQLMDLVNNIQEQYSVLSHQVDNVLTKIDPKQMLLDVAEQMDKDFDKLCPIISKDIRDAKSQQKSDHILISSKFKELENIFIELESGFVSKENFKLFDFKVTNLIRELDFYKKQLPKESVEDLLKVPKVVREMTIKVKDVVSEMEKKVSLASMDDLEKMIAREYATKMMIRTVDQELEKKATKRQWDEQQLQIIALENQSKDFMTASGLEQKFKYLENMFKSKLTERPTQKVLDVTFKEINDKLIILDQGVSENKHAIETRKENIDKELLKIENSFMTFQRRLDLKLTMEDYKSITDNFSRFALYDDFKGLYNKCLPAIKNFENKIQSFQNDNLLAMELVKNFDKGLSAKANRIILENFMIKAEEKYASKEDQKLFQEMVSEEIKETRDMVKKAADNLDIVGSQMGAKVTIEIKKATAHLKPSAFDENAEGNIVSIKTRKHSIGGANPSNQDLDRFHQLQQQINTRGSKDDSEMALRQIEIIHKQLKQLAILITIKFRSSLESSSQLESKNQKTNKKVNLLQQSLLISQWIQNFDPSNINDCFDDVQNFVPPLIQQFESQINEDIKKIESMKLSPNNTFINEQVRNTSSNFLGVNPNKTTRLGRNQGLSPSLVAKTLFGSNKDLKPNKKKIKMQERQNAAKSTLHERQNSSFIATLSPKAKQILSNVYNSRDTTLVIEPNDEVSPDVSRGVVSPNMNHTTNGRFLGGNQSGYFQHQEIEIDTIDNNVQLLNTMQSTKHSAFGKSTLPKVGKINIKQGNLPGINLPGIYNK